MKTIEYRTVDKSAWPDGPWREEPDKLQFVDEATGLACLIKRSVLGGNLCGYVGVDESHSLYDKSVEDEYVFDVHGGITYAGLCEKGPDEVTICHLPEPGDPDPLFWFGFDCGHGWDRMPGLEAREREFEIPTSYSSFYDQEYRDLDYVKAQCALLAAQLHAAR